MIALTSCPICDGSKFETYLSCVDHTVSKETFELKKCSACELLVTSPRPNDEELGRYYQSSDYISHTSKANSLTNKLYLVARRFTLRSKTKLAKSLQPSKNSILDFGCGTGDFLQACLCDGWTVTGVEPGDQPREIARRKNISVFENIDQIKGEFTLITLWHVLEHVPYLNETIIKLKKHLNPNGTLLIAIPNHQSLDAQKYKGYWAGYDVPRHLWHFSKNNVEQLFAKHNLKVKQVLPLSLDSYYVSLLSETYKKKGLMRFVNALFSGLLSNLSARNTKEYSSLIYIVQNEN